MLEIVYWGERLMLSLLNISNFIFYESFDVMGVQVSIAEFLVTSLAVWLGFVFVKAILDIVL